ncbi:MAG: uroporphyrinogen-III synthase [Acidimicrobiaceae bacterium]|nr:uroporphyrinogen-III synthase [Acidimicrobiaceae bacterium]
MTGLRIVVCRPVEQARSLVEGLEALGGRVVQAPVIAICDPDDGGSALQIAMARLDRGDWLVVTSPNGAERAAAHAPLAAGVMVAAVGPGTAKRAEQLGIKVDLVPAESIAEGLAEEFPAPDSGSGRRGLVVLARAAVARALLPDHLRSLGWEVLDVAAYRNLAVSLAAEQRRAVAACDAVAFTSSSTVSRLVAEAGLAAVPPLVASIGPATSATAAELGLAVTVEAAEHTVAGLVTALAAHVRESAAADDSSPPAG